MIEGDGIEKGRSLGIETGHSREEGELQEIETETEVGIGTEIEVDQEIAQAEIGRKFVDRIREAGLGAMFVVHEVICAVPVLT